MKDPSVAQLQAVGLSLVAADLVKFRELVLADAGFVPGRGMVIDGIRHLDTVRILRDLVAGQALKVVYLESSSVDRQDRISLTTEDLCKLDSHPVEAETLAIRKIADLILDTSLLSPSACFDRLRAWARTCG
jgi:hypothetical protein